jgi:hypothetical protein
MKSFTLAAVTIVLLTAPAYAQQVSGKRHRGSDQKTQTTPKPDDKAYNAALKGIPDAKQNYDPWHGVRENATTPSVKVGH